MKGAVLELGGKDPAIVCPDAELANAVAGIAWGGFANAGQTCSGIERVYVHEDVAEQFIEGLRAAAERLRLGDPTSSEVEVGPMISAEQAEKVSELVEDAISNGARAALRRPGRGPGLPRLLHRPDGPRRGRPTRCGSCARRSSAR